MFISGDEASLIIERDGLKQIADDGLILKIIEQIISENQDKVAEYNAGKEKLFGFFVGQVMKLSKGKASPQLVNQLLQEKLKK